MHTVLCEIAFVVSDKRGNNNGQKETKKHYEEAKRKNGIGTAAYQK